MQNTYLIKYLYPDYVKNSQNSKVLRKETTPKGEGLDQILRHFTKKDRWVENKNMTRWPTSSVIRKMPIKTAVRSRTYIS